MAGKYYWIKERHNPQFDKPYFTAYGKITAKEARRIENGTLYGTNYMHKFKTEEEYLAKLNELGIK
jgi:hypothetical protein